MERDDKQLDLDPAILKEYNDIHLSIDVMHVNVIMFLLSFWKHIGLLHVHCMRKKNRKGFLDTISRIISSYRKRGFNVKTIEADGAFEGIRDELLKEPYKVDLRVCSPDGHMETIERQI